MRPQVPPELAHAFALPAEGELTRIGIKFRGRKGDAIIFRNTLDVRSADPLSEHAGLPVSRGVKYLASRWIRAPRHTQKV